MNSFDLKKIRKVLRVWSLKKNKAETEGQSVLDWGQF